MTMAGRVYRLTQNKTPHVHAYTHKAPASASSQDNANKNLPLACATTQDTFTSHGPAKQDGEGE
jgi:hypothetical protein